MKAGIAAALAAIVLFLTVVSAMITHIVVCIKTGAFILLAIGVIVPPVGLIHGIGQWFGVW